MNLADYSLKYIGNMNEMPVAFDLLYSTTLDHCNTSIVNIKTTNHEKINFTVILAYMANNEVCNVDELDENYDKGYDSNYRESNNNNSGISSTVSSGNQFWCEYQYSSKENQFW
ncbi:hypothetical protein RhiirC2_777100 [Rhizophagus irregularis]|uniref:Uncharacterized protein n=1 Tax=Rhizophagus irregularis TaxID=588596 RepID=A0A2N1NF77_9GLOM|nr:hypothetical protein RhiirC2_777100 [Rhizophagus irregularis]